ncbi:ribonuclease HII [Spirochaetia bacterium]|nr:ribonuclease HII [Spirochaetia bacterium]
MICGIDEAGRGPLAGPVCAASVILPASFPVGILGDSKKLSPAKREAARMVIIDRALAWGIGWASATEIDDINILQASLLAMKRAFDDMLVSARFAAAKIDTATIEAVVDGTFTPDIPVTRRALPKADSLIPEVMAASILAKTARDRLMVRYSRLYPEYSYEKHKGYPTKAHRELLAIHGPSPIQRLSFRY